MYAFDSPAGVPPPFGMTPLDRLALQHLIWNVWREHAIHSRTQRDQEIEARANLEASPSTGDADVTVESLLDAPLPAPAPAVTASEAQATLQPDPISEYAR